MELKEFDVVCSRTSLDVRKGPKDWFFVDRGNVQMPEVIETSWNDMVRESVEDGLVDIIRRSKMPEQQKRVEVLLCMAGKDYFPGSIVHNGGAELPDDAVLLRPAVCIHCSSRECEREIEGELDNLLSLGQFLTRHSMDPPHVCQGAPWPASFSGKAAASPEGQQKVSFAVNFPKDGAVPGVWARFTVQSLRAAKPTEHISTVGGIVLINERPYGLTTAQAFVNSLEDTNATDPDGGSDKNSTDSDEEFEPQLKGKSGNVSQECVSNNWVEIEKPQILAYRGKGTDDGDYSLQKLSPRSSDFTLVDLEKLGVISNTFRDPESQEVCQISGILWTRLLSEGEVWIIHTSLGRPMQGCLLKDECSIIVKGQAIRTRRIALESQEAAHGLSGSWVIRNQRLCGVVYAAYDQSPYLHMLPVEDIFRDIARFLGLASVDSVRLAGATETPPLLGLGTSNSVSASLVTAFSDPLSLISWFTAIPHGESDIEDRPRRIQEVFSECGSSKDPEVVTQVSKNGTSEYYQRTAPNFIIQFMKEYERGFDNRLALAEYVKEICIRWLDNESLPSNVRSRAENPESLRIKLLKRYAEQPKTFRSEDNIRAYVSDLSGVRISLYYPRHKNRVKSFLKRAFSIKEIVEHPKKNEKEDSDDEPQGPEEYRKEFKRYKATHYHACLKDEGRNKRFSPQDKVEIQVTTVLHSVWSEVEHNIIYKQLNGSPSLSEKQMLDGLNGLVSIGEMYMEHFNTAYDERVKNDKNKDKPFANRYQLGSFLYSELCETHGLRCEDYSLSSVEILRLFLDLESIKLNTPARLSKKLHDFDFKRNPTIVPLPENKRPNASLVIMWTIYNQQDLESKASLYKPKNDEDLCKIMMSTIISLDKIFAPFNCWEPRLTAPAMRGQDRTHLANLKWLMNDQTPRVILLDHYPPDEEDTEILQSLWQWFAHHPCDMVRFVFNIARLGVVRDLRHEVSLLERIYRMFETLHPGS